MNEARTVYLNGNVIDQIEEIKPIFHDSKIEPTDSMIISGALAVYKEYLINRKTPVI